MDVAAGYYKIDKESSILFVTGSLEKNSKLQCRFNCGMCK